MRPSRLFRFAPAALLLAFAAALGGASTGDAARGDAGIDQALVRQLKDSARGSVTVSIKHATGYAAFVRAGLNGDLSPAVRGRAPEDKARSFLREYGALFGVANADTELVTSSTARDRSGSTVTYRQVYEGVPVFGAVLRAHLDKQGNLTAVNGVAVPAESLSTTPTLSASQASALAIDAVVADPPTDEATGAPLDLQASDLRASAKLFVYRTGLIRGVVGSNQLVYQVQVTNGAGVRDFVFVHAHAGKIVNRYSAANDALTRRVFEKTFAPASLVWQEGEAFPGALNVDQQNIVTFSGQAYYHFLNAFGRDAYDAAGHIMNTVNNDPRIACPNANWNGITTNYCNGVTADDVVAHEWGHAYTEFTSNLIYQWQPGALNESYSDIWGETVDQLNGMQTDLPNTVRTPNSCSTHTVPVPILIINAPTPGTCAAGSAAFGPPLTTTGTTGDLVLADDGAPDPSTSNGCTPLVNNVTGKVVLVDRGVCTFVAKVKNAQNAGAIAVVVANNNGGGAFGLGGADATITIPSLGISEANGTLLKGYLQAGSANVTLKVKGGVNPPQDSYRWLEAEDATAFNAAAPPGGHAIRDMWDPTCLSDPGKVSDAEYQCDPSDGGGVHTNSGVSNHAYSLLVDGGQYNGVSVTGIGLTKAAHIYFRAQSVYMTPTTDFDDHADALEASCADLIGQNLQGLSVTSTPAGPSGQSISAADCNSVSAVIAAVEFRRDPTAQCNFKELLDKNTPLLCGSNQRNPSVFYNEDFEHGLGGWTTSNQGVYAGWPGTNWVAASSLPGGRSGSAAFAEDLDGQCDQNGGDVSGMMSIVGPSIHLPAAAIQSPRVSFDHYITSEFTFDGGNVKISVNGGAFTVIPASAFIFNPYNATLAAAPGNTDPLAGQPAFTGSDGGQVTGSWGTSYIDLTKAGVKPGDTIRLRFDFGMDGCGAGLFGWFVDDVKVQACNTKKQGGSRSVETAYRRD